MLAESGVIWRLCGCSGFSLLLLLSLLTLVSFFGSGDDEVGGFSGCSGGSAGKEL